MMSYYLDICSEKADYDTSNRRLLHENKPFAINRRSLESDCNRFFWCSMFSAVSAVLSINQNRVI